MQTYIFCFKIPLAKESFRVRIQAKDIMQAREKFAQFVKAKTQPEITALFDEAGEEYLNDQDAKGLNAALDGVISWIESLKK